VVKKSILTALAQSLGGLPVYGCLPGSPADRAGVRYGDVLLSVDGHSTPTWEAYLEARDRSSSSIRIRLFRDGTELEIDLVLDRDIQFNPATLAAALGLHEDDGSEPN
jgi:C-terminal processing protease CtpA/Prc